MVRINIVLHISFILHIIIYTYLSTLQGYIENGMPMKHSASQATSVSGASARRPSPVAEEWEDMPYWEKLRAMPPGHKIFPDAYAPLDPKNPKRRAASSASHSNENRAPVSNRTIKVSGDVNAPVHLLNARPDSSRSGR
jgi:hypothetical protein